MHGILDPAFLALFTAIGATIWFAATRGRGAVPLVAVGAVTFFCGALIASLGSAHTIAVIGRALRGPSFVYNFRLYSLVLLGSCQIAGGLRCLSTSWRVACGDARAEGGSDRDDAAPDRQRAAHTHSRVCGGYVPDCGSDADHPDCDGASLCSAR